MINVAAILEGLPHFDRFQSVADLLTLAEDLRSDSGFDVRQAGTSADGVPIHHIRQGDGAVRALIVGGVHAMEPIGGLTVTGLISLLRQRHPAIADLDVAWHIVPCIDPDATKLNEGWTQAPFSLESFMKNYFQQAYSEQVDMSFPIAHKRLVWDCPSAEAEVLRDLLDQILPDFYFPLHNSRTGGAFFLMNQRLGAKHYQGIYDLLEGHGFPLHTRPMWREVYAEYAPGIIEMHRLGRFYDYLEKNGDAEPEKRIPWGASSTDHLAAMKPEAQILVAEMGYMQHPDAESDDLVAGTVRRFKLLVEASSKYLATVLLEEFARCRDLLDRGSPFFRAIESGTVLPLAEKLVEGGYPLTRYPTRDTLLNPDHSRPLTKADRFDICMVDGGFNFLHLSYPFVRLLKEAPPSPRVEAAIARIEAAYAEALAELRRYVDFDALTVPSHDVLMRVQLGSGLVVLGALLEERAAPNAKVARE